MQVDQTAGLIISLGWQRLIISYHLADLSAHRPHCQPLLIASARCVQPRRMGSLCGDSTGRSRGGAACAAGVLQLEPPPPARALAPDVRAHHHHHHHHHAAAGYSTPQPPIAW